MSLTVVLRTCDHNQVHPERGARFLDVPKPLLIKKCLASLIKSIHMAQHVMPIKLCVIDDHSSEETIAHVKSQLDQSGIPHEFETVTPSGYNMSALRQFEMCKHMTTDWVYSVEDDYLHFPECITQLIMMGQRFTNMTGSHVVLRPDDDVFVYAANNPHARKPSMILLGADRHWRTLYSAHNTLFTTPEVFQSYWHLFASLASYFKQLNIHEDHTINLIWEKVPLFSPIPGLAIHISQHNEPPFTDYKSLWESILT